MQCLSWEGKYRRDQHEKTNCKFDDSYIKYGLMEYSDGRPQWTLCLKILSIEALKPYKLNRHVTTIHPEHANKNKDFFQRKKEEYVKQKVQLTNISRQYMRKHSKHRILQPCV